MISILFIFFLWLNPTAESSVKVEWITPTTHDFGNLKKGEIVKTAFRFKNISQESLAIDNIRTSCGCMAADWQDEIVPPGLVGQIQIEFDAKKPGYFYKKITAYFNGQRKAEKLYIEGYVE